jgi:hypothetical protein
MEAELDAVQARAQDPNFVHQCSLAGLQERLPLPWPTPPGTPPSPKHDYRSHYVYLGWQDLQEPATWEHLSDFDLALRLVDFTGLRPVLAQLLGWTSARGWRPFDPVSLFLLQGWQITNDWSRTQTLQNLHAPRYADYAQRFGFQNGIFPTEGGMRYFLTTLGANSQASGETVEVPLDEGRQVTVTVQTLNRLIAGAVHLIHQAGIMSPQAWQKALVCADGMLQDAASRMRCSAVQDSCYQPTTPKAPRPCPAKEEKGQRGCDCQSKACAQACRYTTPRDAAARFVVYQDTNQPQAGPEHGRRDNPNQPATPSTEQPKEGKTCYGYRSLPLQLADGQRRCSFVLLDHFQPANEREENPAAALLRQVAHFYPHLHVDVVAGDAGLGYESYLRSAYALGAKRVVDLRAHPTDKDQDHWTTRGYDDQGRPICPYGYSFTANGFDADRKRHKWFCAQACRRGTPPLVRLANVTYPPAECPYQTPEHPHGQVSNVGQHFPDGSLRLVRDIPVGTPAWKRAYHRGRNAAESRHSTLERWGCKRLPVYGDLRGNALTFQADVWLNLTTMARLVREATLAQGP